MGAKNIRISITSALNAAGIEATKQQVDEMSRSVAKSMAGAATANKRHWADIKAAWDMGCAAIRRAWQFASAGLKSAFHFETQTTQFKTLIGNIDDARAHMADLKALGDTPPFSLDEFAKASKSLMVMTDGALGYKKSLELIGDAAAATGTPIEEMGQAVGRLYAFIRDGQPLSRAVAQLRNMGILSPEVAQKLQDLQAAGKSNAEIWAEVETALGRYKGAMSETEKTGEGLIGALQSRWNNIVRAFGEAFSDTAKGGMSELLDKAKELEEDGSIAAWAQETGEWFSKVVEGATACARAVGAVISPVWKTIRTGYETVSQGIGGAVGAIAGGGGVGDALKAGWQGVKSGFNDVWDTDGAGAEETERKKEEAAKKRRDREAKKAEETAKREVAEKKRLEESLAEGQKKIDEKNAKEKAEKEAKAKEAAAKKAAETQARLDKEAAAARERQAQKELDQKIKNHQKLLAAENKAESEAHSRQAKAESKLQQAWGWYRDKDSMRAQLEEEKADAAARKQFDKDFEKLKSKHRDWRTAENLSVDDEAVRRVALAREEKEAADKHLAEIEKNTADLSAKLDELLSVKG